MSEEMLRRKIDKILSYKTISEKEKIDRLLFIDADLYCNLGSDSLKSEINHAKSLSKYIYRTISKMDSHLGKLLLRGEES